MKFVSLQLVSWISDFNSVQIPVVQMFRPQIVNQTRTTEWVGWVNVTLPCRRSRCSSDRCGYPFSSSSTGPVTCSRPANLSRQFGQLPLSRSGLEEQKNWRCREVKTGPDGALHWCSYRWTWWWFRPLVKLLSDMDSWSSCMNSSPLNLT